MMNPGVPSRTLAHCSILVMKAPASLFSCAFPSCYSTVFGLWKQPCGSPEMTVGYREDTGVDR